MAGMLGDVIGQVIGGIGGQQYGQDMASIGEQGKNDLMAVGDEAREDTQFVGNTVATNTGNTVIGADGGITSTLNQNQQNVSDNALSAAGGIYGNIGDGSLSSGQQNLSNSAMGAAQGVYGEAGQSVASRTDSIFAAAQAAMQPSHNRANSQQANDLYASGRTGFGGGSSEQYALKSAQEDQMMNAFFGARQQAGQEQLQQAQAANLLNEGSTTQGIFNGQQMTNSANAANSLNQGSIMQEAHMGNQVNLGLQGANLAQTGQIAGVNMGTQADVAGVQTQLDAARIEADQTAGMFNTAGNLAGGFANAATSGGLEGGVGGAVDGIMDWLF